MNKQFASVYFKEFKSYFRTQTAYFIMAVYMIISMIGTFYSGYFFFLNNSDFVSFFSFQPQILAILIPAVTMRLWADERKSGTLEYILTQPVNYAILVLGKYCAAVSFCLILLTFTFPLWIYTNFLTTVDNMNVFSGYMGCFLTAAAFCAFGCVISAFCSNAVIAYLIAVLVSWGFMATNFNFIISFVAEVSRLPMSGEGQSFNYMAHFQNFISGQIGIDNIIYFAGLIALTLWFNVFVIEYKRS
ncbi:MAG: hypothetical protein J6A33_04685 [Alphaproteobacteria bacterium]|nr:hypothetical protein [Alphaproteobacteria bacterium]